MMSFAQAARPPGDLAPACPHDLEPARPPREFEEYEIIGAIGQGAMGQVYLARDRLLDRLVAIKFITRMQAEQPERIAHERFSREARALARLQHPNVVSIYRVGQVSGRPYMVSEYVAGRPLDQVAPAPPAQVLALAMGLARGLAAVHQFGVLHRDIKPANILLADTGEVKLLDFGLAKLMDDNSARAPADRGRVDASEARAHCLDATLDLDGAPIAGAALAATARACVAGQGLVTTAGQWIGTPLYMAPELWNHAPATMRSDIYSLGAVLYYLAAGQAPHEAAGMAVLHRRVTSMDAPPLAEMAAGYSPAFVAIIHRCLAREPAARFASAGALCDALETCTARAVVSLVPGWRQGDDMAAGDDEMAARDPVRASAVARHRAVLRCLGVLVALASVLGVVWLDIRTQAKARRDVAIQRHIAAAERAIGEAREHARHSRNLRQQAFLRFDANEREAGVHLWTRALAGEREVISAYGRAERAIAAALRVDPGRVRSHALMAHVLDATEVAMAEWLLLLDNQPAGPHAHNKESTSIVTY